MRHPKSTSHSASLVVALAGFGSACGLRAARAATPAEPAGSQRRRGRDRGAGGTRRRRHGAGGAAAARRRHHGRAAASPRQAPVVGAAGVARTGGVARRGTTGTGGAGAAASRDRHRRQQRRRRRQRGHGRHGAAARADAGGERRQLPVPAEPREHRAASTRPATSTRDVMAAYAQWKTDTVIERRHRRCAASSARRPTR